MHEAFKSYLAACRRDAYLGPDFTPTTLDLAPDGALTLVAEVKSVAAKKRALEIAAALPEVDAIIDRVRLRPASPMEDGEIRAQLRRYFTAEPAFQGVGIREAIPGGEPGHPGFSDVAGMAENARGQIDVEVQDGVVILTGAVPGRVSQRLAGVMAWWVPGVRDVVNGLESDPPEEDAPIRIEEAVRIVLDRNPYVDDSQIRIGVRGRVVRLTGLVRSPVERDMAEADAWCVLGIDEVINEIAVPNEPET